MESDDNYSEQEAGGKKRKPSSKKALSGRERTERSRQKNQEDGVAKVTKLRVMFVLDYDEVQHYPLKIFPDYATLDESFSDLNLHDLLHQLGEVGRNKRLIDRKPPHLTMLNYDALEVAGIVTYNPAYQYAVRVGHHVQSWERFRARVKSTHARLKPLYKGPKMNCGDPAWDNVHNVPFNLLFALSMHHQLCQLFFEDPQEQGHGPHFMVTKDTNLALAIHSNPDQLTEFFRDSVDILVLCSSSNFRQVPKVGQNPGVDFPLFREKYLSYLNDAVVGRAGCRTYPPLPLLNMVHDKARQSECLNAEGLKMVHCHMHLPNDHIKTFSALHKHLTILPVDGLPEFEHIKAETKEYWKDHAKGGGIVLKPLHGHSHAAGVIFVTKLDAVEEINSQGINKAYHVTDNSDNTLVDDIGESVGIINQVSGYLPVTTSSYEYIIEPYIEELQKQEYRCYGFQLRKNKFQLNYGIKSEYHTNGMLSLFKGNAGWFGATSRNSQGNLHGIKKQKGAKLADNAITSFFEHSKLFPFTQFNKTMLRMDMFMTWRKDEKEVAKHAEAYINEVEAFPVCYTMFGCLSSSEQAVAMRKNVQILTDWLAEQCGLTKFTVVVRKDIERDHSEYNDEAQDDNTICDQAFGKNQAVEAEEEQGGGEDDHAAML